ncbi:MAG: LacI family DNA-binding transcriptional regulator [Verrucomicrobiota bacterium]|nr:LacI family DNA-binding transcriptional regulator [Verrucomicrobiota bacterium]
MLRITLKQVAEQAGLSVAAVSQALSNTGNLSVKTRERIQHIARTMGYVPDPMLSMIVSTRLRNQRTDTALTPIALVDLPINSNWAAHLQQMEANARREVLVKAQEYAQKLGYSVSGWVMDGASDKPSLAHTLYHRGVVGVIFNPRAGQLLHLSDEWKQFAVVVIGNDPVFRDLQQVNTDYYDMIQQAWLHVRALGYKRIGFAILRHDPEIYDDGVRQASAYKCMADTPTRYRVPCLSNAELNDANAFLTWYRKYKPEVVIGFHVGMLWDLVYAGYSIPKDVAFVTLHHNNTPETMHGVSIAGFGSSENLMPAALDHMDQLIRHRMIGLNAPSRKLLLNAVWMEGDTCPQKL